MKEPEAKQSNKAAAKSLKEKTQNLPLLCVEAICKFTPTAKLVRLYSKELPLPGACWNFGVEAVLKKRLPLSISDDFPNHQADDSVALFDAAGEVASIKQPNAFRFSPLCKLVERVSLNVYAVPTGLAIVDSLQLYAAHGDALVPHLPNVVELATAACDSPGNGQFVSGDRLELNLKHLVPQLRSFEISTLSYIDYRANVQLLMQAMFECVREIFIYQTSQLQRLVVPSEVYAYVLGTLNEPALRSTTQRFLAGLNSLAVWHPKSTIQLFLESFVSQHELSFESTNFGHLTQLQLTVCRDLRPYLAAFRAMTGLCSLGLHLFELNLDGLVFDESSTVNSVLDLRMICTPGANVNRIASLFPNAKVFALQHCLENGDLFNLVSFFVGNVLPNVEKLRCFSVRSFYTCTNDRLAQFLLGPQLPDAVDLSHIVFENLARNADLLTAVYVAMQSGTIKELLMRGPVHRDALARLQSHLDLNGDHHVNVTAWKDRDLGEQPGLRNLTQLSQQTDIKIVGKKLCGDLKGQEFMIRIVHQLTKRVGIFD